MNDAIESNDIAAVESLLANGSVDVNARMVVGDVENGTFLMLAAELGHVEIVALLLDAGAYIDDVNDHRNTACHLAVLYGHTAVVELLVERKANVSLRNQHDEAPIITAIDMKNERLVMLLIDTTIAAAGTLDDEIACLAATVSADVIRLLRFKHRIDLSTIRDNGGRTPLQRAQWRRADAGVIDSLIEVAGVYIDARDRIGCTAAHFACSTPNAGTLARLIAAGANVDLADKSGRTPLHYCTHDTTDQIACCLLAAGVNVHAKANNVRTACHAACECSHVSLPVLLACGADLDEADNDGVTPRQLLKSALPAAENIERARRRVLNVQLSLVRKRAFEVCVGLHSRGLDALCMCEILLHSCGPVAPFVPFHRWWQIATTIKHFRGSSIEN